MRDRIVRGSRDAKKVLSRASRRFFYRKRRSPGFPGANPDSTFSISDNHQYAEIEASAAGNNSRDAPHVKHLLVKFWPHPLLAASPPPPTGTLFTFPPFPPRLRHSRSAFWQARFFYRRGRSRHKRRRLLIVYELGVDATVRAEHGKTRTLCRSVYLRAYSSVSAFSF